MEGELKFIKTAISFVVYVTDKDNALFVSLQLNKIIRLLKKHQMLGFEVIIGTPGELKTKDLSINHYEKNYESETLTNGTKTRGTVRLFHAKSQEDLEDYCNSDYVCIIPENMYVFPEVIVDAFENMVLNGYTKVYDGKPQMYSRTSGIIKRYRIDETKKEPMIKLSKWAPHSSSKSYTTTRSMGLLESEFIERMMLNFVPLFKKDYVEEEELNELLRRSFIEEETKDSDIDVI